MKSSGPRRIGAAPGVITDLEAIKTETHFTAAVRKIKPAVPARLLVHRHNPLTLLHYVLSKGIHSLSDDECLAAANAIRNTLIGSRSAPLKCCKTSQPCKKG